MDVRREKSNSPSLASPSKPLRSAWEVMGISDERAIGAVKRGLPIKHLDHFLEVTQLPRLEVLRVLKLTSSELQKRADRPRLTPLESERLWRLANVYKKSLILFEGNAEQAIGWLKTPQLALGNVSPIQCIETEPGASEVEELIGRIEYGVYS